MSFGSTKNKRPEEPKLFGAQRERVATNESARPLPWFAGTRWLGVTWVGDVFGVRTEEVEEKIGKKKQAVARDYFCSFAALVCGGPVDRVSRIKLDGELVWIGDLVRADEDYVTITVANRGVLRLYWGTETQEIDADLEASGQDHSAYRGQCYIVGDDFYLGTDRTTVPNPELELSRRVRVPFLSDAVASIPAGDPGNTYDANPVAVLYDWWTNRRFGMGRDASGLDEVSLAAAAQTLFTEGMGVSPLLTSPRQVRQAWAELLENVDAYPSPSGGKLGLELVREADYPLRRLTASDLNGDPRIDSQSWADTFDETRVKFRDHDLDGDDNMAKHHDLANFAVTRRHRAQTLERPWIVRAVQAAKLAGALGRVAGLAQASGKLSVREESARDLSVGRVFELATRDGSVLQVRVTERSEPKPGETGVDISFETDRGWANAEYFSPAPDAVAETPVLRPAAASAKRILEAPYALAEDRTLPTLLWAVARGDSHTTNYDVWKASAEDGPYASAGTARGQTFSNFLVRARLTSGYTADTLPVDQSVGIRFQVEGPDAALLAGEWDLEQGLSHELLCLFGEEALEVASLFDVTLAAASTYEAKCVRALYDTRRRDWPEGTELWIGLRTRLDVYAWPPMVDKERHYKFQTRFGALKYDLAALGSTTHRETARTLRPIAPPNLRFNGDGHAATWPGGDATVTWSNTSRARTVFGLPLGEVPLTDLESVVVEVWRHDGSTLLGSYPTIPDEEYVLDGDTLAGIVGPDDFAVRVTGVRGGRRSLDYTEVLVRQV
jgi:hypothetical protein